MMTRCKIRSSFFAAESFNFQSQSQTDILEFTMPFTELKHIVDGLSGPDGSGIIFEYPVGDGKLQITINDRATTNEGEKFQS
jgi:hypothetical protein